MAEHDTPPDELPAIRVGRSGQLDLAWMWGFRRELSSEIKDARRENSEAMGELRTRLSGIEGRISEGAVVTAKHADQLAEVIEQGAEHEARIRKLEIDGTSGLVRRMDKVEAEVSALVDAYTNERAANAALARQRKHSVGRRLMIATALGAATALGPVLIAFLGWLALTYARAKGATP